MVFFVLFFSHIQKKKYYEQRVKVVIPVDWIIGLEYPSPKSTFPCLRLVYHFFSFFYKISLATQIDLPCVQAHPLCFFLQRKPYIFSQRFHHIYTYPLCPRTSNFEHLWECFFLNKVTNFLTLLTIYSQTKAPHWHFPVIECPWVWRFYPCSHTNFKYPLLLKV